MKIRRRRGVESGADLTPMIDVVFQLILFFLVSTTFAVLPGITVNLPNSETAQATELAGITITDSESGKIWFNEEPVTYDSLNKKLKKFDVGDKKREEYPVTLEADEKVTNGMIVKIFDILRKNNFIAVNLRTTD